MIDPRLLICAAGSVIAHFVLGEVLSTLPPRTPPPLDRKIEIRVIEPPAKEPPPEPEKPPPPPPPDVKPVPTVVHQKPTARPAPIAVHDAIPSTTPVPEHAVVVPGAPAAPAVFGATMESTSQGGTVAVPVGNTTQPGATGPASTVKPLAAPVAAYEVTKMPLPQGRCSGKYTDAARAAALEGTVVLDLVVDEQGRARDIVVVEGLGHGLTEAAVTALKECRFTPGEKDGKRVPVKVRSFKIRFVLQDAAAP